LSENRIKQQVQPAIAIFDFQAVWPLIKNRWRFLLKFGIACAVVAGAISFLVPNRYTATATILPTTNGGVSGGLLSLAENIPGLDLSSLGSAEKSPSLLYPEILSSRLVAQEVLDHPYIYKHKGKWQTQNLYQYFDIKNPDKAVDALSQIVNYSTDRKTGVLTINVTTVNPQLSALVANYYLECLDNFNQNQRKTSAGQNRQFIEKRLAEAKSELAEAESNLKNLRQQNMNYYSATDPELAMIHGQLQREVEVKSQVYLTLCQQYELASIQEKKESPVIQILDSAQPPTIKSGPKRVMAVVVGFLMGFLAALTYLILENRNPELGRNLKSGISIKRIRFIRKKTEDPVIVREHVEQY
jgi:uncharacterized protein involved in exopolysaccharide biosynthesis